MVERWHPEESTPEILSERLRWSPADGIELDLDLATFFGEVWGE